MLHVDANGDDLPQWLLPQIKTYPYVEKNRFAPSAGQTGIAPVPWDEQYLAAWENCVRELGQRYDNNPTVVAIHVGGPSRRGSEVFLPAEVAKLTGYSGQRVLEVWKRIFASYDRSFPSTAIVLDLAQPTPDRSLSAERLVDEFRKSLGQPVVQHNSLSAKTSSRYAIHQVVVAVGQQGAPIGFQQLCESSSPRHGGPLSQALQTAANAGATVILSVTAVGTPPPSYQWKNGGNNVSNGTMDNRSAISGAASGPRRWNGGASRMPSAASTAVAASTALRSCGCAVHVTRRRAKR